MSKHINTDTISDLRSAIAQGTFDELASEKLEINLTDSLNIIELFSDLKVRDGFLYLLSNANAGIRARIIKNITDAEYCIAEVAEHTNDAKDFLNLANISCITGLFLYVHVGCHTKEKELAQPFIDFYYEQVKYYFAFAREHGCKYSILNLVERALENDVPYDTFVDSILAIDSFEMACGE